MPIDYNQISRMMHSLIKTYFDKYIDILSKLNDCNISSTLEECANMILECSNRRSKVMIAGNGGSAAQSQHFAAELVGRFKTKRRAISAFALSTDSSVLTCIGNDFGYEKVFSRQIEAHANKGDLFIGFTTSGKSKNILEALHTCKLNNVISIIFTGDLNGDIKRLCDSLIKVPSNDSAIIQEFHHSFAHLICEYIDLKIQDSADCIWDKVINQTSFQYKYLILDRDGVINELKPNGYITNWSEFVFTPSFLKHIGMISNAFEKIYIVSNQRGVGKGLMSKNDLDMIHKQMLDAIEQHGGRIDGIYVCTAVDSNDFRRKPNIGMAIDIKNTFPTIDFTKTIVVGDSITDKIFADKIGAKFIGVK